MTGFQGEGGKGEEAVDQNKAKKKKLVREKELYRWKERSCESNVGNMLGKYE